MIAEKCACLPSEMAERITFDEFLLLGEFYAYRSEEEKKAVKEAQKTPPPPPKKKRR